MNFRKSLVAVAAMTALVSVCAPAQAFSFLGTTSNADGSFSFAKDTKVQFDFFASHGAFKSDFFVYNPTATTEKNTTLFSEFQAKDPGSNNKNDSKGTCPTSVKPCTNTFTFAKGVSYFFGLTALNSKNKAEGTVFTGDKTTSSKDAATAETFKFVNGGEKFVYYTNYVHAQPLDKRASQEISVAPGTTLIAVNDSWSGDADYNDFIVTAKSVPEPGTIGALLGVGALGFMGRRRKAGQAAKV